MEQSTLQIGIFSLVAVVIVVAAVGINLTGDVIKTTSKVMQRKCMCQIEYLNNYGEVFETHMQEVRAKSGGGVTDVSCNNRCQRLYKQRNKIVTGWALPRK